MAERGGGRHIQNNELLVRNPLKSNPEPRKKATRPPNDKVPRDGQKKATSPDAPPAKRNRAPSEEAERSPWGPVRG